MITKEQIQNEPIKALSWKEPFGSLMLPPHLKVETRTWYTKYRGLVLICTSKEGYRIDKLLDICGDEQFNIIMDLCATGNIKLLLGMAIAIARLTECELMMPEAERFCFVKHHFGLYCHIYTDVTPIKPFSWKGSQGFRNVSEEERGKIEVI